MADNRCAVCKKPHRYGRPSAMLTRAYIAREYEKELQRGGNATTVGLRLAGGFRKGYGNADYYHVIHAINEFNRSK